MKQNANPTIYSVQKKERGSKDPNAVLIGTRSLRRFQLGNDILVPSSLPSAEERSVYLALSSVLAHNNAANTGDKQHNPLGVIKQATDMSFPDSMSEKSLSHYRFQPSSSRPPRSLISSETLFETEEEKEDHLMMTSCRRDAVEAREVFDIIRNIQDPEHPLSLEQLNVVNLDHVLVIDGGDENSDGSRLNNAKKKGSVFPHVDVRFTPTIPHCSMAMLIGLCIRVKLLRSLPTRFKVTVRINPGTHASELAVNKQLADKERVRAAIENVHLVGVVNRCIGNGMLGEGTEGVD